MDHRNRRTNRTRLGIEPLEGRAVPSTGLHPGAAIHTSALVQGTQYLFLNGEAHGTTRTVRTNPDAGTTVALDGSGRVSPLGQVHVSGTLHGTGFIQQGQAGGTVRLSNARGSVTLSLEGPTQGGFTPPPSGTYRFTVESGTGAYAHALGTGTVDVTFRGRSFTLAFHGDPNHF
jgi:hypothetical protein